MDGAALAAILVVAIPLGFAAFWCGIVFVLASVGGWRRLARTCRATGAPGGRMSSWETGRIGGVPYRNMLTIHASASGLHLSVPLPFRVGHPDLMIPWSAVHDRKHARVWGREVTRFAVGKPAIANLELPTHALQLT